MVPRFLGANDPGWKEKVLTSQGKTFAILTTEGSKGQVHHMRNKTTLTHLALGSVWQLKKCFLQYSLREGKMDTRLLLSKEMLGGWHRTTTEATVTLESFPTIYF